MKKVKKQEQNSVKFLDEEFGGAISEGKFALNKGRFRFNEED